MPAHKLISLLRFFAVALGFGLAACGAQAHNGADSLPASPQAPTAHTPVEVVTGTVKDFIVDNRVSGIVTRYVALRLDDGSTVPLRGAGLDGLLAGQRVEATGTSAGTTIFVTATRVVAGAPVTKAANAQAALSVSEFPPDCQCHNLKCYGILAVDQAFRCHNQFWQFWQCAMKAL